MERKGPNGPNRTKVDLEKIERIGPKNKLDQKGPNRTEVDRLDRSGHTGLKQTEQEQCGLNRTEVYRMDRIEPKWTNGLNRSKKTEWTELK